MTKYVSSLIICDVQMLRLRFTSSELAQTLIKGKRGIRKRLETQTFYPFSPIYPSPFPRSALPFIPFPLSFILFHSCLSHYFHLHPFLPVCLSLFLITTLQSIFCIEFDDIWSISVVYCTRYELYNWSLTAEFSAYAAEGVKCTSTSRLLLAAIFVHNLYKHCELRGSYVKLYI